MLAAILFDLDGTLVRTDPLHFRAWQTVLAEFGRSLDLDDYNRLISGRQNAAIVRDLLPDLAAGAAVAARKEAYFQHFAVQLERPPGLDALLDWCAARRLKLAVVTNAPRANAEFLLAALDLTATFPCVVLGEEAPRGKPDPAPYQLALVKLEVAAAEAIAFEDSPLGVRAAVGADLTTFGVASTHTPESLMAAGAIAAIADFTAPALWAWLESAA